MGLIIVNILAWKHDFPATCMDHCFGQRLEILTLCGSVGVAMATFLETLLLSRQVQDKI